MSKYWLGTVKRTETGVFTCRHCGWQGNARVKAVGVGTTSYLSLGEYEALAKAEIDAKRQAEKDLRRARCRRCGQRAPGTALAFAWPWALGSLAALWLATIMFPFVLGPIGLVAIPVYAWQDWQKLDRGIEWLDRRTDASTRRLI